MTTSKNVLYYPIMNKEAQEIFDRIVAKDPEQLTEPEKSFLRARRGYLKKSQLEEYENVLEPKVKNQTSDKTETVKKEHGKSK